MRRSWLWGIGCVVLVAGCQCGKPSTEPTPTHAVKGTVEGLLGTGLVLQNNGGDDLAVSADGEFAFKTAVAEGSPWAVTVLAQPTAPAQTCELTDASGTMGEADVTGVAVHCTTNQYSIGGTVTGYEGSGLVLQNNDGDDLEISADGAFTFATPVESGKTFTITVKTQPQTPSQTCAVSGGSGTVVAGEVTTVTVNCATDSFTIGGTVSGLAGSGLELQNGAESIPLAANGTFSFPTPVKSGASFDVTVKTQPASPSQTCTVESGTGTVGGGNVTAITVSCVTNQYSVSGVVTGLKSSVVLQNNLGDDLTINADGSFTFPTPVESGKTYDVSVLVQPTSPWQTCTVNGANGTIVDQAIDSVVVSCVTNQYAIGGTLTGLSGTGLTLQNNGTDDLVLSADGTFTFATPITSGMPFDVTISAQPTQPWQTCAVTGGSGTVGGAAVASIAVNCVTDEHTVGGTVAGLAGTGLTVQLNGGTALPLSANGTFAFPTPLPSGTAYAVTLATQPTSPWQTCTVASGSGTLADTDVTGVAISCVTNEYPVGGNVSGLAGSGLLLQNNGGAALAIIGDGAFQFAGTTPSGQGYSVTVSAQPESPWQTCTVTDGSGSITNAAVSNIQVSCVTDHHSVGGTVSGLQGTLTLDNGGDPLVLNADGTFVFPTEVASGNGYAVTVTTQPTSPSQTCTVSSGSGTITDSDITSVQVQCTTNSFPVSFTVTGLLGELVLTNNGADAASLNADGQYTFSTPVLSGQPYLVEIQQQPAYPSQVCTVSGGSGTVGGAAVTQIAVNCTTNTYTVGGTVSGLLGSGLVLANGGETVSVGADGSFAFSTPVASGSPFTVTVASTPTNPEQTCNVNNGTGTVTNADITSVEVVCVRKPFDIQVNVSGLTGSGLVLQNNASDNLSISADGPYTFSSQVGSGLSYNVTVLTQPTNPWQTCTVASPSGIVGASNVVLTVTCTPNEYYVGGTASGDIGGGLSLQLNGGAPLAISSTGTFVFPDPVQSGMPYQVSIATYPPGYMCWLSGNSFGTIEGSDITDVGVTCFFMMPPPPPPAP